MPGISASQGNLHRSITSIFLPYIHPFSSEKVPLVKATVHGVEIDMPVDTGSTGILIGAPLLPHVDPSAGTPAHKYLSSSNFFYKGRMIELSITFHGIEGSYATATVPMLIVDESYFCPWYEPDRHGPRCPKGPNGEDPAPRDISKITYMGVGFGRNRLSNGQLLSLPKGNAFLNIHSINSEAVSPGDLWAGYTMSTEGVNLGLTSRNTHQFDFISLEPGPMHGEDQRDWAMPRACFHIDGAATSCGFALVDTGIPQMYIRTEEGGNIPATIIRNPNNGGYAKWVKRVKPGTRIALSFISVDDEMVGSYAFSVGVDSMPMAPAYVVPARQASPPFVNTGRHFLFGYSIAFDAISGQFGFRPVKQASPAHHSKLPRVSFTDDTQTRTAITPTI